MCVYLSHAMCMFKSLLQFNPTEELWPSTEKQDRTQIASGDVDIPTEKPATVTFSISVTTYLNGRWAGYFFRD